jgi:hypothetical protein
MNKWPSGAYLVLECKAPETGVDLVALGYKYNSRKVMCFILTKNAGSTAPSLKPYIAKCPDQHGNVRERRVQRPAILGEYFDSSDVIDSHNHCRQFRLALERLWLTKNPWFRLDCTFIGMTVIDAFRGLQYHTGERQKRTKMTVADFADALAWDCVHNPFPKEGENDPRSFVAPAGGADSNSLAAEFFRENLKTYAQMMSEELVAQQSIQGFPRIVGGGRTRHSNESALTADSTIFSNDSSSLVSIGEHDTVAADTLGPDGRPSKQNCIICGTKTRDVCCHYLCRKTKLNHQQKSHFGFPLCNQRVGARKHLTEYGEQANELTCLQIHRDIIRKSKEKDLMKTAAERRTRMY